MTTLFISNDLIKRCLRNSGEFCFFFFSSSSLSSVVAGDTCACDDFGTKQIPLTTQRIIMISGIKNPNRIPSFVPLFGLLVLPLDEYPLLDECKCRK